MIVETDEDGKNILVGIEAVKACKRSHHPPLMWFSYYANISDDKKKIKEWIKGRNKTVCSKDLITDDYCLAGYEADFIILLGTTPNLAAYMSRCRGQFVHVE